MATILITGANRGLGLELTRQYLDAGWRVLACCRQPDEADDLKKLADRHRERLLVNRLEVTDFDRVRRLAGELAGEKIDILFNNAGISGPEDQRFGDIDAEGWLQTLQVNVVAPLKMAEAFVEAVAASDRRIIATMGSLMGSIGDNSSGGYYAYRSSKAGVHMVVKSLAVDLKEKGITAVALHPGWVRTDMGGPKANLSPEESVRGLRQVLDGLKAEDSGTLIDHAGRRLQW